MNRVQVVGNDEGNLLHIAKGQYRIIVSSKDTNGEYAIIEMNVPPGGGPGPHAHNHIEEVFYVATGEIEFRSDSGFYTAKAGDTVRIPKDGGVHAFTNTSDKAARLICTVYPAGLDEMFVEVSSADPAAMRSIGEKHGNEFFTPDYFDSKS